MFKIKIGIYCDFDSGDTLIRSVKLYNVALNIKKDIYDKQIANKKNAEHKKRIVK